ncbi:hypothetical protein HAX54_004119 [Datura stramonium]|uniref:Uncharacterized protein n=1 Tax=Datura stramonium TaxID=4076 RepID=A0ABS8T7T1_DATST|nr:hypothetical protein [Datura stramonium]
MYVSLQSHQSQASIHTNNTQAQFALERLEEYYTAFKNKRSIHAEVQFEVDSFKNAFTDIYDKIGMRNLGPFTIPVDLYFTKLVWKFYASCRTVRANNMITLAIKTDKDALAMKQAKCTMSKTPPPPLASSTTSTAQFHPAAVPSPTRSDLL